MALSGNIGATIHAADGSPLGRGAFAFGEEQGRYLVTLASAGIPSLVERLEAAGIPAMAIGKTGGSDLGFAANGEASAAVDRISLDRLRHAHESFLPTLMRGEPAVA